MEQPQVDHLQAVLNMVAQNQTELKDSLHHYINYTVDVKFEQLKRNIVAMFATNNSDEDEDDDDGLPPVNLNQSNVVNSSSTSATAEHGLASTPDIDEQQLLGQKVETVQYRPPTDSGTSVEPKIQVVEYKMKIREKVGNKQQRKRSPKKAKQPQPTNAEREPRKRKPRNVFSPRGEVRTTAASTSAARVGRIKKASNKKTKDTTSTKVQKKKRTLKGSTPKKTANRKRKSTSKSETSSQPDVVSTDSTPARELGDKMYRCTFQTCTKMFNHRGTAHRHVKLVHLGKGGNIGEGSRDPKDYIV